MDLESLRIFCVVAKELSITRAAAQLGRVPSNVTTRMQHLQADVGVDLFVRTGKRMTLSPSGELLLGYAQRMLALAEEAEHVITEGRHAGTLRVGAIESATATRLPTIMAIYHTRNPAARLDFRTGTTRALLDDVREERLDCAFIALPNAGADRGALKEMGLLSKAIWRDDLLLLLPESSRGVRRPSDVQSRSLAAFAQGCTYRNAAEQWLGIAGPTDWTVREVCSYFEMATQVCAGQSVALLPKSVFDILSLPSGLKSVRVGRADTCLVWRSGYAVPMFRNLLQQLEIGSRGNQVVNRTSD